MWQCLGRSGHHSDAAEGLIEMTSGSSKTIPFSHTSNYTLTSDFKERLISRKCDVEWAPHSPDLNHPDLYLWGYLKSHGYQNNPKIIDELKSAAKNSRIPREECMRVIDNFAQRLLVCLQCRGANLEHLKRP